MVEVSTFRPIHGDWNDTGGYGSHVAGMIAVIDNSNGAVGVALGNRFWPSESVV